MKRPNKRGIREAIYVTSYGHPTSYQLVVKHHVGDCAFPIYDFRDLDGVDVGSFAAANALVRTMREHVEKVWRGYYADHKRAQQIAAARRRAR